MKNFTDIVNRLKTVLSLTMDKDVAEFLGLSKSAFAERKRRGVFPENALRLVELSHPELKLDVEYILTGESNGRSQFEDEAVNTLKRNQVNIDEYNVKVELPTTPPDADTPILLNSDEMRLLSNFRKSDLKGKQLILDTAKMARDYSLATLRWTEYTERDRLNATE